MLTTRFHPRDGEVFPQAEKAGTWGEGAHAGLRRSVLILSWFLAAVLFVFLMANTLNTNSDDISSMYPNKEYYGAWASGQMHNLRFFSGAIGRFVDRQGLDYFHLIALWAVLFTGSIWLLGHQVARTLGFGFFTSAWIGAAVSVHGFMAELYTFTTAYLIYAAAMAGAALLLYALSLFPRAPRLAFVLGASGAFMCLGSYQPLILVPAFAFGLSVFYRNLTEERPFLPWKEALFLAGCVVSAVFVTVALMLLRNKGLPEGPVGGRLSLAAALDNWWRYLRTLADIYFSFHVRYDRLWPIHERLLYFAATCALIVLPVRQLLRAQDKEGRTRGLTALAAALGLVLLIPGVFNLFGAIYWPTPRSMISVAFFHAALVALLVHFALRSQFAVRPAFAALLRLQPLFALALGVVALSAANQASTWFARALQARADIQAASAIVDTLRSRTQLGPNTVVAVQATWQNFAQRPGALMDSNISAFSAAWSQVPMLRLASGVSLREAPVPPGACDGFQGSTYEVRQVKDVWVVCMN